MKTMSSELVQRIDYSQERNHTLLLFFFDPATFLISSFRFASILSILAIILLDFAFISQLFNNIFVFYSLFLFRSDTDAFSVIYSLFCSRVPNQLLMKLLV